MGYGTPGGSRSAIDARSNLHKVKKKKRGATRSPWGASCVELANFLVEFVPTGDPVSETVKVHVFVVVFREEEALLHRVAEEAQLFGVVVHENVESALLGSFGFVDLAHANPDDFNLLQSDAIAPTARNFHVSAAA